MSIKFIPYEVYIPHTKHNVHIYLKTNYTANNISTSTNKSDKNIHTSKYLQVMENGVILKFNISYTTLHLLYKYLKKQKNIQKLYVHCKYTKYTLNDIIHHFKNLQDILKIKQLILII